MKKGTTLLSGLAMTVSLFSASGTFAQAFFETMGDASGAPAAANNAVSFWESSNRFDNDALTMTGTTSNTEVRNISDVQGNHAFISRNGGFFMISGVNTVGLGSMQLSFKLQRGSNNPTQFPVSNFKVEVSSDGTSWTQLGSAHLATSGVWQSVTATGAIPQVSNLRVRFSQPGYTVSSSTNNYFYRIDDVRLVSTCTAITLSGTSSDVSCNGGSNGAIDITATGSGPISYSWSNGATSEDLTGVSAGTYTLSATNACGAVSQSFTVGEPTALSVASTSGAIACFGGSTTVEVSAAGGTAPYSGTGSNTVTAGNYAYTVTDANGCSASTSIIVTEPALLTANAAVSDAIDCYGETGQLTVFAAGGTTPYSGTGAYTVSAGDYSYTVTDANGCTASVDISIAQPELLVASSSVTDAINCNGQSGVITVTATGGTPAYAGLGDFTVTAGTYDYLVTDANGCEATTSTTITEPEVLTVNAGGDETVFYGYGPMECADLSASINGGTPDYNAVWTSNVSGGAVGADVTVCPETNEVYTVSVTDANGCTASDQLSICVVNVECQAGNSDIIKVEMCQIPPGNPANAHTICVDENAVPAHLAIGCTLGACGELDNCNYSSGMAAQGAAAQKFEAMNPTLALTAYPNPTKAATTVSVTPVDKGEYTIVLTDMTGRVIAQLYNGFISDYENRTFDVEMSSLTGGIYVVNVIGSNGIMDNLKIVKE